MAIYNLFNAGNVISMNITYGAGWQDVRQILGGRLVGSEDSSTSEANAWREAAVLPPLPITSRTSLSA